MVVWGVSVDWMVWADVSTDWEVCDVSKDSVFADSIDWVGGLVCCNVLSCLGCLSGLGGFDCIIGLCGLVCTGWF